MSVWNPSDIKSDTVTTIGASETDAEVSKRFRVTSGGARYMIVAVGCSNVTVGAGITLKLRSKVRASSDWVDKKSQAVTANGETLIKWIVDVENDLLGSLCDVVATTGAGSSLDVDYCVVVQDS